MVLGVASPLQGVANPPLAGAQAANPSDIQLHARYDQPDGRHDRGARAFEPAESFEARSIAISDGDSFEVRRLDGRRVRIRLAGIDAPEKSQPWANVARDRLGALLRGRTLSVAAVKTDRWGRLVAFVDAEGEDVALTMLDAGLAWHYPRYDHELPPALRERYARAAAHAREERVGLWRAANPEPPWEFRRRSR
ncbi:MAG: thermonuclease family protein [Gammaproteobacteria bacterium]